MKVLVVGGSGFIGTRLLDLLVAAGHEVGNLDLRSSAAHPGCTTLGDVRDTTAVRAACEGVDVVALLAAEHRDDVRPVSLYDEVNVDGARVVAAAAAQAGVQRIVFTSSVAVYGLDQPFPSEEAVPAPFNDYGRTKLEAEAVLSAWALAGPARSLEIVRPAVVFGENNRGNVYNLVKQVASGRFLLVGDGSNRKSMGYVGNVAAFLAGRLESAPGVHVTNYADSPDLTTRELVDLVRRTLGVDGAVRRLPLPVGVAAGHVADVVARISGRSLPVSAVRVRKFSAETTVDTSRLRASGFVPGTGLADAVRATVLAEFGPGAR